jgi:hypothetical protein
MRPLLCHQSHEDSSLAYCEYRRDVYNKLSNEHRPSFSYQSQIPLNYKATQHYKLYYQKSFSVQKTAPTYPYPHPSLQHSICAKRPGVSTAIVTTRRPARSHDVSPVVALSRPVPILGIVRNIGSRRGRSGCRTRVGVVGRRAWCRMRGFR